MLNYEVCFEEGSPHLIWQGHTVKDKDEFCLYLSDTVYARLEDLEEKNGFELDLRAIAETDMQSQFITEFMTTNSERQAWEVGEALAECLLEDNYNVTWPWNNERDKRTPRASLPGADLVGFIIRDGETAFIFGEVKTSGDLGTPPGVMTGRGGMINQLDQLAFDKSLQKCLLQWLNSRCKGTPYEDLYKQATRTYLASHGKKFVLCGFLMRDTTPDQMDLKNRANSLSKKLSLPIYMQLAAWYLPVPIDEWVTATCGDN